MSKKILMVVTSNAIMGATGKPTGIWVEELAVPYYAFIEAGFGVDIASPKGGAVPFDPNSIKSPGKNHGAVERMLVDVTFTAKTGNTLIAKSVSVQDYQGVFFPGGHGTMWDMADNSDIVSIVETADRQGLMIGAVCHGVAALVSAKTANGVAFVNGRNLNSFTNAEEAAAGLTNVMPFLLETRLRDNGARFEAGANWQAFAVRDGRLITGQNPASSALVAAHMLQALQTN